MIVLLSEKTTIQCIELLIVFTFISLLTCIHNTNYNVLKNIVILVRYFRLLSSTHFKYLFQMVITNCSATRLNWVKSSEKVNSAMCTKECVTCVRLKIHPVTLWPQPLRRVNPTRTWRQRINFWKKRVRIYTCNSSFNGNNWQYLFSYVYLHIIINYSYSCNMQTLCSSSIIRISYV